MASLKELLFKPRWQHRSAEVRERAVAEETDPRLLELLPEIAREDAAAPVRLAALRRIHDLLPLMRAASDDEDPGVREAAYRSYRALLAGESEHAPSLDERLEIVPRLDDDELVQHLAEHGREEPIRAAALARITRQGLLGDLAVAEKSRALRLDIIARLDQVPTLERVAETLRTRDKKAHRAALDRIRTLGGQSEEVAETDVVSLCEALEALTRSGAPREQKAETLASIDRQWQRLAQDARERHERRYTGAHAIVERLINPPPEPTASPEAKALAVELDGALQDAAKLGDDAPLGSVHGVLERLVALRPPVTEAGDAEDSTRLAEAIQRLEALQETLLEAQPVDEKLTRLAADADRLRPERANPGMVAALRERWDSAWKARRATRHDDGIASRFQARLAALESQLEKLESRRTAALDAIDGQMDALEAALGTGNLADSVVAKQKVLDSLQAIGSHPRVDDVEFRGRVAAARGQLRELRDWQHWANNKVRTALCAEAEGLLGSGLHPDAVAERVKELRARWKELDAGERLPGDPPKRLPAPGLFRRFQSACNKAFTPAKAFFDKRAEVREHHKDELDALAGELEAAAADDSIRDVRTLEALVRRGRRSMRELSTIPPKARAAMARRLREGAGALDKRLDDLYAVVERRKQRIIDEVAALDPSADLEGAMNAAKDAQQRWKAAGHARRKSEQALWKTFREACDRIFDHQKERNAAARAAEQEQLDRLDDILKRLEACAESAAEDADQAAATLRQLAGEWRSVGINQRGRERRYQQLHQDAERAIADRRAEAARALRDAELGLVKLCQEAEARWYGGKSRDLDAIVKQVPDLESVPAFLRERWESAQGDAPDDLTTLSEAAARDAAETCIALEFLAGVETPEPHRQARMDYQVARLSARMSGEAVPRTSDETATLVERWARCGPLDPAQAADFRQRVETALAALGGR